MIILNAKIFILIEKVAQRTFYPLNCCWNEFREKTACNNWVRLENTENKSDLKLISSLVSFLVLFT